MYTNTSNRAIQILQEATVSLRELLASVASSGEIGELLFITSLDAGHGGASGRYDAIRETAFDYAFVLWQVGKLSALSLSQLN